MIVNDRHLRLQAKLGMVQPFTPANVQGSSIDLTLGSHIQIESPSVEAQWLGIDMSDQGYQLSPGEFILAHTEETIQVPTDCAAMVLLRSSAARAGFEHSLAGWCDPGFNGQITLELRNNLRFHPLLIAPGMRLCQLVVHKLQDTAVDHYGVRGNYQHQSGATLSNLNFDREAA